LYEPQKVAGIIGKEECGQYKYDYIEKDALNRSWTINGAVASTSTTTLTFVSTAGMQAGMTLMAKVKDAHEFICIDSVTNTTQIVVKRNIGATTFQVADKVVFENVGYCAKEGGSKRGIRAQVGEDVVRYLQIFKNTFGITGTLLNSDLVVSKSSWSEEMTQAQIQHQKDKEFSMWFNPDYDSTTDANSNTVYLTRGIYNILKTDYSTNCDGSMTELEFMGDVCADIFAYGSSSKLLIVDAAFMKKLMGFAWVRQQTRPGDTKFGLKVSDIETDFGELKVICTGVFSKYFEESEAGMAMAIDPNYIKYKYQKGRDGVYQEGIQTPGDDVKEASFLSQCGVTIKNLNNHRFIYNIGQ